MACCSATLSGSTGVHTLIQDFFEWLGHALGTLIRFIVVAWVVFLLVKAVNVIRRRDALKPVGQKAAPPPQEALLAEIRDLLKAQVAREDSPTRH